jgi:hypothetical protein
MSRRSENGVADRKSLSAYSRPDVPSAAEQDALLHALTSADRRSDIAVARTRRRIYGAMQDIQAQRSGRRKQTGLVLMISVLFVLLLSPAIWCAVEVFRGGGHFVDMQAQTYLLALMLFPGIVAAGIAGYLRNQRREHQNEL